MKLAKNAKIMIRQSPEARKRLEKIIDKYPGDAIALLRRWLQERSVKNSVDKAVFYILITSVNIMLFEGFLF